MKIHQVKVGIVLSYILMAMNALYAIIVTPFVIKSVGEGTYGVYKTIASLTSAVMILDLGLGGTVQRYVAKYRAEGDDASISGFLGMSFILALVACSIVAAVSVVFFFLLNGIYGESFTSDQLSLARIILIICSINVVFQVISNVFNGAISGYNKFSFSNGVSVLKILLRIVLGIVIIQISKNIVLFVMLDLFITIAIIVCECLYLTLKLKSKVRFQKWDIELFKESSKYALLMFLTSVASQISSNLDNVVIGAIRGPELVTVYSIGLLIFTMFGNISTAVSGVMLPTVTRVLSEPDSDVKIINILIKAGRFQFILLSACVIGFVFLGKDFISLWMGEGYEDVYLITLILIVPSMFEYCINVVLSVLRAKNLLGFRTVALSISCLINLVVTIVLVKYWSYIGAAIGTSITYFLFSLIIMNVYYYRKLRLPMLKIYSGIIKRLWLCDLVAGVVLCVYSLFINGSVLSFIGGVSLFVLVYLFMLLVFGFSKDEKRAIPIIGKFFKKEN